MSKEKSKPTPTPDKNLVPKQTNLQEGYVPPPMATNTPSSQRLPDETKGYTPPPMPTVLKPPAPQGVPPSSSQPTGPSQTSSPQTSSNQGASGGSGDGK